MKISLRFGLPWLIALTAVFAAAIPTAMRFFSSNATKQTRFENADGIGTRYEIIELNSQISIHLRYGLISDSGVEIGMVQDELPRWHAYALPLGVDHSAYRHSVECKLVDDQLRLKSIGYAGTFVEWRNLYSGRLIKREQVLKPVQEEKVVEEEVDERQLQERVNNFRRFMPSKH